MMWPSVFFFIERLTSDNEENIIKMTEIKLPILLIVNVRSIGPFLKIYL